MSLAPLATTGAIIKGEYRYLLWRIWDDAAPQVVFTMCNPSTADEAIDDPTIRRCIGFARHWGFGSLSVVNLFAYRSSSPQDLLKVADPIGPENTKYLLQAVAQAACCVVAWGSVGRYLGRDRAVVSLLSDGGYHLDCLGRNQDGSPKHPLYIRKGTERQCFLSC